jgi:DNA-binding CsgD family transcriptional regulator
VLLLECMLGEFSISINTVNTHRARILEKMGMRANAELIRYAVEHGLTE